MSTCILLPTCESGKRPFCSLTYCLQCLKLNFWILCFRKAEDLLIHAAHGQRSCQTARCQSLRPPKNEAGPQSGADLSIYLMKYKLEPKMSDLFFPVSDFDTCKLCSPFAYKNAQKLIWKIYLKEVTLFKIIKSPQWNCHTLISAFSIHMHLKNVKIGYMTKVCQHSTWKSQKQVKNWKKTIKICLFWPDFDLI